MATKAEALQIVSGMGLPAAQARVVQRAINRATSSETIDIAPASSGEVIVRRSRAGKTGRQVFQITVQPNGDHEVVQLAYDDAGKLIHYDPKGGAP